MIGNQVKGRSFRGVLQYLHSKERSQLIGGNMSGDTPQVLAAEFGASRRLNPQLGKAVYHASLSLPPGNSLEPDQWNQIAADYVEGMGFQGSQYIVYRHQDREHDHIHIVASRIRIIDGSTVSDSWDYPRSETIIRQMEQQYELPPAPPSQSKKRRTPPASELRRQERTGEPSARASLLGTLDQATTGAPTMPQFMARLKSKGIDAGINITRTGKIRGISYQQDGVAFSGTKLGKAYTFPGLQRHRQVEYRPEMHEAISQISQQPPATATAQADQQSHTETVAKLLTDFLDHLGKDIHQGQRFAVQRREDSLVLSRLHTGETLVSATRASPEEPWQRLDPLTLNEGDQAHLDGLSDWFYRRRFEKAAAPPRKLRQRELAPQEELEL